jgi:hypothetical protein
LGVPAEGRGYALAAYRRINEGMRAGRKRRVLAAKGSLEADL